MQANVTLGLFFFVVVVWLGFFLFIFFILGVVDEISQAGFCTLNIDQRK